MVKTMLFRNFEDCFPPMSKNVEYYYVSGPSELTIKLGDGRYILYDDFENTIYTLPSDSNNMTEVECKREFGRRLTKILWRKQMTQQELSRLSGIPQSQISDYATGRVSPSFYRADKIARVLDCSIEEFRFFLQEDENV